MEINDGLTLGEKIARLRKQRGWTQGELAEKIFVHNRHVTRLERDKMKPSEATMAKLVEVLGIKPDDLLPNANAARLPALHDPELVTTFKMAQQLDPADQTMVMHFVQALFTKKRMEQVLHLSH